MRLLLLVALPLMAAFAVSNAIGWKLSQQIIDDTQHTPWTTEADKARYMAKRSGRNCVCAWAVNLMDTPETP
jgi:GGDEF domain-containing protein